MVDDVSCFWQQVRFLWQWGLMLSMSRCRWWQEVFPRDRNSCEKINADGKLVRDSGWNDDPFAEYPHCLSGGTARREKSLWKRRFMPASCFSFFLLIIPTFDIVKQDYLMAALVGGLLNGTGIGLVFRRERLPAEVICWVYWPPKYCRDSVHPNVWSSLTRWSWRRVYLSLDWRSVYMPSLRCLLRERCRMRFSMDWSLPKLPIS